MTLTTQKGTLIFAAVEDVATTTVDPVPACKAIGTKPSGSSGMSFLLLLPSKTA